MNFVWKFNLVECSNVSTTNLSKGLILCNIIGDVYKFIGYYLIPLDPCKFIHIIYIIIKRFRDFIFIISLYSVRLFKIIHDFQESKGIRQ